LNIPLAFLGVRGLFYYHQIKNLNMNKTINIVELASELAHERMKMEIGAEEDEVWIEDGILKDDCLIYTDEAQDSFNEWYDYYYTQIEKL
jgi:hypothetical protein